LGREVITCRECTRLVRFREGVPPKPRYRNFSYWRKPVPGFGDSNASLVIIGLAPAAHGGNRTGRVFSGDESGRFLVRALHKAGFANQPYSESRGDGLRYRGCYLTAAVKCSPPQDRPSKEEFANCSKYLRGELDLLSEASGVLVLGQLAFRAFLGYARKRGARTRGLKFKHGACYRIDGQPRLYVSYHPSPRNTNTGKLEEGMLVRLLMRIRRERGTRFATSRMDPA
jgi:uracil-DNA glycosylase family 4